MSQRRAASAGITGVGCVSVCPAIRPHVEANSIPPPMIHTVCNPTDREKDPCPSRTGIQVLGMGTQPFGRAAKDMEGMDAGGCTGGGSSNATVMIGARAHCRVLASLEEAILAIDPRLVQ
jgi:hypothetical protein